MTILGANSRECEEILLLSKCHVIRIIREEQQHARRQSNGENQAPGHGVLQQRHCKGAGERFWRLDGTMCPTGIPLNSRLLARDCHCNYNCNCRYGHRLSPVLNPRIEGN